MAQDATKIFAGPATKVETSPNDSTWTDLGFANANAEIAWEPANTELMDGNMPQLSGLGKLTIELVQTDSATLTILKGYRTAKAFVRITAADNTVYKVSGVFLSYAMKRGFKSGEPHMITVTGQRHTIQPDDWCAFPA